MARTLFRLLSLLLVTASFVLGQETLYTLRVDVPWVALDVTVTDHSGKTVSNLSASDFQVFENGVPQEIHGFTPVSAPYNILLLFDRSGSTQHKWLFMQKAVAGFIAHLRPQDRIMIDSFDFEFEPLTRWTDKRDLSLADLGALTRPRSIGGTAFYQSLETVVQKQFRNVNGRRAVVVLTDGRDTSLYKNCVTLNRVLEAEDDRMYQRTLKTVRDHRIPIYFVAVNTDLNLEPNTSGDEYQNLKVIFPDSQIPERFLKEVRTRMQQLSEQTGGRVLYPNAIEDIIPLYEQIGNELGTAYSLAYVSENPKPDGSLRRIEVRATDGTLHIAQSRSSYYANRNN